MIMKNIQSKLLRKAKFVGKIISSFPYVGSVVLTGSLAQGHANQNSDIDIMIIAKGGRVFTTRFFINTFGTIFGIKRSKDENKNHAGKFCFNYFIADNYLILPTGRGEKIDRYCAEDYSRSKFIAGDKTLHQIFLQKNKRLFEKYGYKIKHNNLKTEIHRLNTSRFEKWVKNYQIKKIESDPRTKKYPNLIAYNDNELRFHPPKAS
jgi:predicted nucleotidyltransferase